MYFNLIVLNKAAAVNIYLFPQPSVCNSVGVTFLQLHQHLSQGMI